SRRRDRSFRRRAARPPGRGAAVRAGYRARRGRYHRARQGTAAGRPAAPVRPEYARWYGRHPARAGRTDPVARTGLVTARPPAAGGGPVAVVRPADGAGPG